MAKVQADGYAPVKGAPFSNAREMIRRTYDFSLDAGALADEVTLATFSDACLVRLIGISVETAFTSGGSATIDCGLAGGTGVEFLSAEAVASFSANALVPGLTDFIYVGANESIEMDIGTAALTAGKAEFIFEVIRP